MKHEIWLPANESIGDCIEISNFGGVRSKERMVTSVRCGIRAIQMRKPLVFRPWITQNGYLAVAIKRNGIRRKHLVHRLVATVFLPPPSETANSIDHINGIKTDNRAENLEWVSREENTKRQWRAGRTKHFGEHHPGAKLNAEQVSEIRQLLLDSKKSQTSISREYGVSDSLIHKIKYRKAWARHSSEACIGLWPVHGQQ